MRGNLLGDPSFRVNNSKYNLFRAHGDKWNSFVEKC